MINLSTSKVWLMLLLSAFMFNLVTSAYATTYYATSPSTLVSAINSANANPGSTIAITNDINLSLPTPTSLPTITSSVTINGTNLLGTNSTLTGLDTADSNYHTGLYIYPSSTITVNISHLNITGCNQRYTNTGCGGSAILCVNTNLTLSNCNFSNNSAGVIDGAYSNTGGALYYNAIGGTFSCSNCTFTGNTVYGMGGAAFLNGNTPFTSTTFTGNHAYSPYKSVADGGIGGAGNGGAICCATGSGAVLQLSGCTVDSNGCGSTDVNLNPSYGGGIYFIGGMLQLTNTSVQYNTAVAGSGIYDKPAGPSILNNCTVQNNTTPTNNNYSTNQIDYIPNNYGLTIIGGSIGTIINKL